MEEEQAVADLAATLPQVDGSMYLEDEHNEYPEVVNSSRIVSQFDGAGDSDTDSDNEDFHPDGQPVS